MEDRINALPKPIELQLFILSTFTSKAQPLAIVLPARRKEGLDQILLHMWRTHPWKEHRSTHGKLLSKKDGKWKDADGHRYCIEFNVSTPQTIVKRKSTTATRSNLGVLSAERPRSGQLPLEHLQFLSRSSEPNSRQMSGRNSSERQSA